jgi:hypothetical protein
MHFLTIVIKHELNVTRHWRAGAKIEKNRQRGGERSNKLSDNKF